MDSNHGKKKAPGKKAGDGGKKTTGRSDRFPIVAIGASAGGVSALKKLFGSLSPDTGMAFVVILHLSREHESSLPQILGSRTRMTVRNAEDGETVAPNHVYIIPADRTLSISGRTLQLSEREAAPGKFRPINRFFRSLAEQLEEKAVGIILSGTGSDGIEGLGAIQEAGGLTFVQSEESAEFPEMPLNALRSGKVDFVLAPEKIGTQLGYLMEHPHLRKGPPEVDAQVPAWEQIQSLLRTTGIDFSRYKPNTIRRRISRRLAINRIQELDAYVAFLQEHPKEIQALREDLLIKVTEFFRDQEVFAALEEEVFPKIVENLVHDVPVRIWVPGCASGEEVYSLAIALSEFLGEKAAYTPIQIFGTDVSGKAVDLARQGFYSPAQVKGLSEERVQKFFVRADGGYRVKKQLREICIFSRHDFTKDPPFSRMDLVSCRNVLIYFGNSLQEKVLPVLHYALRPGGFLLLGSAEGIGQFDHLFAKADKKHRIFVKKKISTTSVHRHWPGRYILDALHKEPTPEEKKAGRAEQGPEHNLQREVDRMLLRRLEPAGVVVDNDYNVVQFRGNTGSYLEHQSGQANLKLLKMLRGSLLPELSLLLDRAKKEQVPQQHEVTVHEGDGGRGLLLEVIPFRFEQDSYFLVQFIETPPQEEPEEAGAADQGGRRELQLLRKKLATSQQYAQQIIEEKDEALEDLKAANEEILSSNEELQSINEELETAKEELESTNEELTTVNSELQDRNEELRQAHNDMANLIQSAQIPFLIVNEKLKIRRMSADAEETLNIVSGDVGRSVSELKLSVEIADLEEKLLGVIRSGQELEEEIQARNGRWKLLRLQPYRADKESPVSGVVLALFDIDRLKRSMEETERAYKYALRIVDTIKDPLLVLDEKLRVKTANPAFFEKFQVSPQETEGQKIYDLGGGQWDHPDLRRLLGEILPKSSRLDNYLVEFEFPHLGLRSMMLSARKMKAVASPYDAILLGIEDVTEQKQVESYLRRAKRSAEEASQAKTEFLANVSHEIRTPMTVILSSLQYLQGTDLQPQQERCIGMARHATDALLDLLDDLIDFSRIEVDKVKLQPQVFDLRENVEDAVSVLRKEAEKKGLELHLRIAEEVPRRVRGDRKRLRQVLVNLVGNAIKFTEEGDVQVHVELAAKTASDAPSLQFAVRDTGIGIPAGETERLFQSFTQLDSSTTRQHGGAGLGLAICKGLVERMGGSIWVESREGEGSTFFFTLPFEKAGAAEKADGKGTRKPAAVPDLERAAAKVLIAEDEAYLRELVSLLLQGWGMKVLEAENGGEALEVYRNERPDLILMDLRMPGVDGLEATRTIRREEVGSGRRIPIIAFTAHVRPEARSECLKAGLDEVLTKPVDMEKLLAMILRFLKVEQAGRE